MGIYTVDDNSRIDLTLELCQEKGRPLTAGQYAQARINGLSNWDSRVLVNSWCISGKGIILYVHRPLFTPDDLTNLLYNPLIHGAMNLSEIEEKVERLIEEGKEIHYIPNQTIEPRDIWYQEGINTPNYFKSIGEWYLKENRKIPLLNENISTTQYREKHKELFPKDPLIIDGVEPWLMFVNTYLCKPLIFDGPHYIHPLDAYSEIDECGRNGFLTGRFVGIKD